MTEKKKRVRYTLQDQINFGRIYDALMDGHSFNEETPILNQVIKPPLWHAVLWGIRSWSDRPLIGWCHYGSSANRATKKELRWILNHIFEMRPTEFIKKYTRINAIGEVKPLEVYPLG